MQIVMEKMALQESLSVVEQLLTPTVGMILTIRRMPWPGLDSGTYIVTVTDASNCTLTDSVL